MISRKDLGRFTALLLLGVAWFGPETFRKTHGPDEVAYFKAFDLSLRHLSPYLAPRFVYTPAFARAGAFAVAHLGAWPLAIGLRLVNLSAACLLCVFAFDRVPSLGRARLPLAAACLVLFRPLTTSMALGNLSPIAAATTVVGVALATSAPVLAGAVLGAGLAVKLTGLPALLVLAALPAPRGARRHLVAIAVAAGVLLPLFAVDARLLPEMLGRTDELRGAPTNLSPHRLLAALGLDLPAVALAAVITLPCMIWVRTRRMTPGGLVAVAGLSALLWLPRVREHSFSMLLPAIATAVGAAVAAVRGARGAGDVPPHGGVDARQRALLGATWTLLGVTCVEVGDACADVTRVMPGLPWSAAWSTVVPLAAAVLLTRVAVRASP